MNLRTRTIEGRGDQVVEWDQSYWPKEWKTYLLVVFLTLHGLARMATEAARGDLLGEPRVVGVGIAMILAVLAGILIAASRRESLRIEEGTLVRVVRYLRLPRRTRIEPSEVSFLAPRIRRGWSSGLLLRESPSPLRLAAGADPSTWKELRDLLLPWLAAHGADLDPYVMVYAWEDYREHASAFPASASAPPDGAALRLRDDSAGEERVIVRDPKRAALIQASVTFALLTLLMLWMLRLLIWICELFASVTVEQALAEGWEPDTFAILGPVFVAIFFLLLSGSVALTVYCTGRAMRRWVLGWNGQMLEIEQRWWVIAEERWSLPRPLDTGNPAFRLEVRHRGGGGVWRAPVLDLRTASWLWSWLQAPDLRRGTTRERKVMVPPGDFAGRGRPAASAA